MQYEQSSSISSSWASYENNNSIINNSTENYNIPQTDVKQTPSKVKSDKPVEKSKRKQVKNACVNCQKACKKCDDGRPCKRCIKLGLTATCRDSDRKERKKGVKRGPYKKRQTANKDKPVYPKLLTGVEQNWKAPIYENVPQVLGHATTNQDTQQSSLFLEEETYCVPSQHIQLSPTSSCSFDESDETLHYAYGYGYTNTITSSSSPSMLDHNQAISGNVTPIIQEEFFNSWDDYNSNNSGSSHASPIGCNPIITNSFNPFVQQKQELYAVDQLLPLDFYNTNTDTSYWLLNQPDMSIEYQPLPELQFQQQQQQQQQFFEYNIPSQQQQLYSHPWTFSM